MKSWKDIILKEFPPGVSNLTIVADPDLLLLEEDIQLELRNRGFEVINFDDPIVFRYEFEAKYRSRWDSGQKTKLSALIRTTLDDLNELPYDILQAGRQVRIGLAEIFPNLNYSVVSSLDLSDLDALYEVQEEYKPDNLGENATKDFILKHVFGIVPELIKKDSDLLRILLSRHYRNQKIPKSLDERLVQLLRKKSQFDAWPLEDIVPDKSAFFEFLQEKWADYLRQYIYQSKFQVNEESDENFNNASDSKTLPFEHDDIRIYMDNLFVEGLMEPARISAPEVFGKTWMRFGIISDEQNDITQRFSRLFQNIKKELPGLSSRYTDWVSFAHKWAELCALMYNHSNQLSEQHIVEVEKLIPKLDSSFTNWLFEKYASLSNLPPITPVMAHHVLRYLKGKRSQGVYLEKLALVVLDGLSFDQWITVKQMLYKYGFKERLRENAIFAWIPTITSISRQALFSGKMPMYFPESIHTTNYEELLWKQFWENCGVPPQQIGYMRSLNETYINSLKELLDKPKLNILGLVIDKIDKIMHGMQLGAKGMHSQIEVWMKDGFLINLINLLLEKGFTIYLTSDHGNVEAEGIGNPGEGAISDTKGERVRIFPDSQLRSLVKKRFADAIEWPKVGLPDEYYALIAPGRKAFIREGAKSVSHGGITIEEVIVPLVEIERKS